MCSLVNQEIFRNVLKTKCFLQYYHKVRYFTNKKINQEMNFLILLFLRDKVLQMNLNCNSILQNFKDAGTDATNHVFIT